VGSFVGISEIFCVGCKLGLWVGSAVGFKVGDIVGDDVGAFDV
jgi:hypothetical protein